MFLQPATQQLQPQAILSDSTIFKIFACICVATVAHSLVWHMVRWMRIPPHPVQEVLLIEFVFERSSWLSLLSYSLWCTKAYVLVYSWWSTLLLWLAHVVAFPSLFDFHGEFHFRRDLDRD
ncbi:hypothetical protein BJ741DRAFT_635280 [Chytriomyces cf. hyalinus JEL632]|nr:hypothetical protein BJ741DRAFT_635280 [Chytriomyces cf. hyalinus JEL632]